MKVLLVAPNYPSPRNKHSFVFMHSRTKIYSERGLSVQVCTPSNTNNPIAYSYEDIKAFKGPHFLLKEIIEEFDLAVIAVHAPSPCLLTCIHNFQKPTIVWIHGAEVLIRAFHHYIAPLGMKNQMRAGNDSLITTTCIGMN